MPEIPQSLNSALQDFLTAAAKADADAATKGQTSADLVAAHDADTTAGETLSGDNSEKLAKANALKALIDQLAAPSNPRAAT